MTMRSVVTPGLPRGHTRTAFRDAVPIYKRKHPRSYPNLTAHGLTPERGRAREEEDQLL